MGSKKKQTVGYRYYADVHLVFCRGPIDAMWGLRYGGKEVMAEWFSDGYPHVVNAPDIFGGDSGEGGFAGITYASYGNPGQIVNVTQEQRMGVAGGVLLSAYRYVAGIFFSNTYWGNAPYLKKIDVMASRVNVREYGGPQWRGPLAAIDSGCTPMGFGEFAPDMNPAHIIRECITDIHGGMGYLEEDVDDASFTAAAEQLFSENFGLSYFWEGEGAIEDFLQDVVDTIDARLYVHPRTGLFTLSLLRPSVGDLPTLGPAVIREVKDYRRPMPHTLVNEVTLNFWDRETDSDASVTVHDEALARQTGAVVPLVKEYKGIVSRCLALRVARRDLRAASTPLLSAKISCLRLGFDLLPGDAFWFEWPDAHEGAVKMRVVTISFGGAEGGELTIDALEDVFYLEEGAGSPLTSAWADPASIPLAAAIPFAVEAPYFELVQRFGETNTGQFLTATPGAGMVLATAATSAGAINASVYEDGEEWSTLVDLSPRAELGAPVALSDTELDLVWTRPPRVGSAFQLGEELMVYYGLTEAGLTLCGRGILDTVPAEHDAGSFALAWDDFAGTDEIERAEGETVALRVRLRNNSSVGALADAAEVVMSSRAVRPYAPGGVSINGFWYPAEVAAPFEVEWAHRDRLLQTGAYIDTEAVDVGPEEGTEYHLRILAASDSSEIYAAAPTSGNSLMITAGNLGLDSSNPEVDIIMELWSTRDGFESWQRHRIPFVVTLG